MESDRVEIRLGKPLRDMAVQMAAERDVSVGQIMRDALSREIARRRTARPPVRTDERLVAPLRARLADDLAHSTDWGDLQDRLQLRGYRLHAAGGGLALHEHPSGRRICKASELGFSYSRLMRRFAAPFPGHAHTWLAERMLTPETNDDDDIDVIERF
ncbi:hypothetical protein [Yoonia sp. 208BN28-4]|uniref:hypothetical protein n=1 Tax=Yoonia sp. 208BN28-4 TaxID=3126505 RepID=UPI003098C677